jgi:hypothetical protein
MPHMLSSESNQEFEARELRLNDRHMKFNRMLFLALNQHDRGGVGDDLSIGVFAARSRPLQLAAFISKMPTFLTRCVFVSG